MICAVGVAGIARETTRRGSVWARVKCTVVFAASFDQQRLQQRPINKKKEKKSTHQTQSCSSTSWIILPAQNNRGRRRRRRRIWTWVPKIFVYLPGVRRRIWKEWSRDPAVARTWICATSRWEERTPRRRSRMAHSDCQAIARWWTHTTLRFFAFRNVHARNMSLPNVSWFPATTFHRAYPAGVLTDQLSIRLACSSL